MGDAPRSKRISIIDRQPAGMKALDFVADLVADLNARWRRQGVPGAYLVAATWDAGVCWIDTAPGQDPLTADRVRRHIFPNRPEAA